MERAFSPFLSFGCMPWGVAPGWDKDGALPLNNQIISAMILMSALTRQQFNNIRIGLKRQRRNTIPAWGNAPEIIDPNTMRAESPVYLLSGLFPFIPLPTRFAPRFMRNTFIPSAHIPKLNIPLRVFSLPIPGIGDHIIQRFFHFPVQFL